MDNNFSGKEQMDKFKEELDSILNIYVNAKLFFQDAEYLYNPDTEEEKKLANDNFFIRRTRIAAWRSTILELCKLFNESKNEHFNLLTFLNTFLLDYDKVDWKHNIPKDKIDSFVKKLNTHRIKSIRNNLKTLRDTGVAHTDKKNEKENEKIIVTFKELKELLNLTEIIIQELKHGYLDTHVDFLMPEGEKAGGVLKMIDKYWKIRQQELDDKYGI